MYPCPYTLIPSSVINIPNQSGTLVTTDDQVTHHYQTRSTVYIKVHFCCTLNELGQIYNDIWASQAVLVVKNLPANAGDIRDAGSIPGSWRSPGGGMSTHSSILAWRISWTEDPGGLQSVVSQRDGHNWSNWARTHTQKQGGPDLKQEQWESA